MWLLPLEWFYIYVYLVGVLISLLVITWSHEDFINSTILKNLKVRGSWAPLFLLSWVAVLLWIYLSLTDDDCGC